MKLVVAGPDEAWEELKEGLNDAEWIKADVRDFALNRDADAFFNLADDAATATYPTGLPALFINSVVMPLKACTHPANTVRINGWKGFLRRNTWELSGELNASLQNVLTAMGKRAVVVKDEPGFISARIIAMIVNEAYFAKGEDVSTEAEIDIAMRLGTNYPKGPFEWASEIGIAQVYALLLKLKETDARYIPAPALEKAFATP
jgi:3-hydroxybutyryl-CoA dehydrogenase